MGQFGKKKGCSVYVYSVRGVILQNKRNYPCRLTLAALFWLVQYNNFICFLRMKHAGPNSLFYLILYRSYFLVANNSHREMRKCIGISVPLISVRQRKT